MDTTHTPTSKHNPIVRAQVGTRPISRRTPNHLVDQFATAMEELAIALRKAKRASKWERVA